MTTVSESSDNTIIYKNCPNCHLPVPQTAKFCRHCGYKFIVPKPFLRLFLIMAGRLLPF